MVHRLTNETRDDQGETQRPPASNGVCMALGWRFSTPGNVIPNDVIVRPRPPAILEKFFFIFSDTR